MQPMNSTDRSTTVDDSIQVNSMKKLSRDTKMIFLAGVHEMTERMDGLAHVDFCLVLAVIALGLGLIVCFMKKEKKK